MEYSPYNCVVEQTKVAELVIGNDMRKEQVKNCIEFMVGCLNMCGLGGDGEIIVIRNADTIMFYKQTYIAKQYVLPIRLN